MRKVCLLWLLLALASVYSESVRETETWVPNQPHTDDSQEDLVSSGDFPNSSDFEFPDEEDDDDEEEEEEMSGSGDHDFLNNGNYPVPSKPDVIDNRIPEMDKPNRPPSIDESEIVQRNEVGLRSSTEQEDVPSNVLMAHASDESIFNKTEVIAALIAGGSVGVVFAIVLVLLLVYRMKKKDEGSYDLGKKPIYKKAPTTEIYA
ncbi:syndecan-4 isoform X2 [Scleropages formosus]|uniref:syndecan-4 isoform X2 n=1 Tax=Scleropages formosus TaxID=113540 RepID=UPI0010FABA19|nr:syndecan-4-like isoform X2 [Scleropages formosus]